MIDRVALFILALLVELPISAHAAEDLVSQLEGCTAPDGFSGSFYSITPGDMGLGYNLKFRVDNGQGYYARDHAPRTEKSKLVWGEWKRVPRIASTREGRLTTELQSPTVLLLMDVSIGGRTITGTAEHLNDPNGAWHEKRPEKFKVVCTK